MKRLKRVYIILSVLCAGSFLPVLPEDKLSDDSPRGIYESAMLYEHGNDSVAADTLKSSALYRLAAEKGYSPAANYLGFLYYNGEMVNHDVDSALYWIRTAARDGDIRAAGNIGFLLSQAPDVTHDYQEAYFWLSRAAEAGLPTSFTQLADLYRQGLGVETDTAKAVSLMEKAIAARVPDAQQRLLAMMGHKWEALPADSALKEGIRYYTTGAPLVGADLIEKAAEADIPQALALLGDAYSKGAGVNYDHDLATAYFLKAALAGEPSAQFIIGELLDFFPDSLTDGIIESSMQDAPDISPENLRSAEYWYGRAATGGVTDSESAERSLFR